VAGSREAVRYRQAVEPAVATVVEIRRSLTVVGSAVLVQRFLVVVREADRFAEVSDCQCVRLVYPHSAAFHNRREQV
jgi:hypothetical protein